jgi:hypothetical protein
MYLADFRFVALLRFSGHFHIGPGLAPVNMTLLAMIRA